MFSRRKRSIKKIFLISCEGETEEFYLKGLMRSLPRSLAERFKIEPHNGPGTDCLNIVREAAESLRSSKENIYAQVWAFFDHDNQETKKLIKAKEEAERENIKIAFTSMSIEYYFLLHFQYTAKQYSNCSDIKKALKKAHWPGYDKPAPNSWSYLFPSLHIAIKNCARLRREKASCDWVPTNPYTNIDLMIDSIMKEIFEIADNQSTFDDPEWLERLKSLSK